MYTQCQHTFQFKQLVKLHVASDDPFKEHASLASTYFSILESIVWYIHRFNNHLCFWTAGVNDKIINKCNRLPWEAGWHLRQTAPVLFWAKHSMPGKHLCVYFKWEMLGLQLQKQLGLSARKTAWWWRGNKALHDKDVGAALYIYIWSFSILHNLKWVQTKMPKHLEPHCVFHPIKNGI